MASYLITGIAGFLGSWLARELVDRGEHVRGIDDLSTGSLHNLEGIQKSIDFLQADFRDPRVLVHACEGIDYIFHFAAVESVQQSVEAPIGTSSVNLEGTLQLIAAAQAARVCRIVFASSAAVYGVFPDSFVREDSPATPLSPYATQKLSCEHSLANACAETGLETVSLRYFNVFGPRQAGSIPGSGAGSGVVARFLDGMLSTNQAGVVLYGDGKQERDFIYVADAVTAALQAMHAPAELVAGKAFNIGTGHARTISLTFEALACMVGYAGDPRQVHARPQDPRRVVASIAAAAQAFGFKPATSFAEGLYKTVTFARQQVAAAAARPLVERRRAQRSIPTATGIPSLPLRPTSSTATRRIDASVFAEAVKGGELELFYQPTFDLTERRVVGVEALLRWRSGTRLFTPAHFTHLAEQKGLTSLIGLWTLETACLQLAGFQTELNRPGLRVAVNIAAPDVEQKDFLNMVDGALRDAGLSHDKLAMDVSERTLLSDSSAAQHNLAQLRRRGIKIAVDDFGTGQSDMNYLYRCPIDCIKIDQSFVQHKGHTRVLAGIVAFARTLSVRTVAEGVESRFQLNHVTAAGCDEAQGFFIGRPVPAADVVASIVDFEESLLQEPSRSAPIALGGHPDRIRRPGLN